MNLPLRLFDGFDGPIEIDLSIAHAAHYMAASEAA
jgi:hypothetical protein